MCEPCLDNIDCPPCLSKEQYFIIYFLKNIIRTAKNDEPSCTAVTNAATATVSRVQDEFFHPVPS